MGISERLGGLPSLTAVMVLLTGVFGAMLGPPILNLLGVKSWAARGLAIGTASHGIGTARALQVNEVAGVYWVADRPTVVLGDGTSVPARFTAVATRVGDSLLLQ